MSEFKSIISYQTAEHGMVIVKLADMLRERGITRNRLHILTGVKYDVIDRYYQGNNIERVDLDFLAKVCFALNCDISDLLEYRLPE